MIVKEAFSEIPKEQEALWKSCNLYFALNLKHSYIGYNHSKMFTSKLFWF